MPETEFKLPTLTQVLDDGTLLAEALCADGHSFCDDSPDRPAQGLSNRLKRAFEAENIWKLHRHSPAAGPVISEVTLDLDPPKRSPAWTRPVTLRFHVARWSHAGTMHIARVPALGIEVLAEREHELDKRLADHIRHALQRTKAGASLLRLAHTQRTAEVRLGELAFTVAVRTPRQVAEEDSSAMKRENKPVLEEVATDLTKEKLAPAWELDELVASIAGALAARRPQSVLLVGPPGVGKTAAVRELVRRRAELQLGHTPFWATSGSRLVAGMSGFGMWQERCRKLCREAAKLHAVLDLGNLFELLQVGRSSCSQQGIASFLRPAIGRGDLLAIAECSPGQLPLIEREDPHLLDVFHQLTAAEPDAKKSRAILVNFALAEGLSISPRAARGEGRRGRVSGELLIEDSALDTLDRLHRRYATYSAWPGRPLRFLKNLLTDYRDELGSSSSSSSSSSSIPPASRSLPESGAPLITASRVTAAFSRETGLPLFMLDDAVPLDLDAARAWFAARVIGQPEAIALVTDLLATVKARLARPRKPLASLLFIGPTGVGKTELAKSLAAFLFGDAARLTRFDMSEFADAAASRRLIAGGPDAEGLLTARVREQPFSVVLLDEFEKSHPLMHDLLLQVLGEGRLTDAAGRVADFTNAVVILTSNLGAQGFQKGPAGFAPGDDARRSAREHFTGEVQKFLRPELFNRLDAIVPFAPLDEATVLSIAARELELARRRDGVRLRGLELHLAPEVTPYLARRGFDARYGARPLKRAIERELLVPLADALNGFASGHALSGEVAVARGRLSVKVRAKTDAAGKPVPTLASGANVAGLASACATLRRSFARLKTSATVTELENTLALFEALKLRRIAKKQKPDDEPRPGRPAQLKSALAQLDALSTQAASLEAGVLVAIYEKEAFDEPAATARHRALGQELSELLRALYRMKFDQPDAATLGVFSEDRDSLWELARAYRDAAKESQAAFRLRAVEPVKSGRSANVSVVLKDVEKPGEFLAAPREGVLGIVLGIAGTLAWPRFEGERGLHTFVLGREESKCLVHTTQTPLAGYEPPAGIERKGGIVSTDRCRTYDRSAGFVEDRALGKSVWQGTVATIVSGALSDRLDDGVKGLLA